MILISRVVTANRVQTPLQSGLNDFSTGREASQLFSCSHVGALPSWCSAKMNWEEIPSRSSPERQNAVILISHNTNLFLMWRAQQIVWDERLKFRGKSKRVQLSKVSSVGKDEFWVSFSTRQVLIGQVGSGRLPSQHVTLWWVGSVLFWLVWTVFSQLAFIMTVCQSALINAVWIKLLLLPILACLSSCSLKTSMLVCFVSSCCIFLK